MHMWGQRPRLDDDNDDANDEGRSIEAEGHSEHERERVKSDGEGGFLVRPRLVIYLPCHSKTVRLQ